VRKNYWLLLVCVFLVGCAEQKPVQVVSIKPTTYKVLAGQGVSESRVNKKMQSAIISTRQSDWTWPVKGNVLSKFSPNSPKYKGIDIAGQEGSPVLAASDGEVVYSGNSLKGYGNLLIIKHKKNFLTAYAHNKKLVVKEGDRVVAGQKIAEMGRTGTDRVKLHFEVRQDGKPIDPQKVLPLKR
jgi:lipoprotein NlpD